MGKAAFGSISGVPWSTTPETAYDVIMENWSYDDQGNVQNLSDEAGKIVLHVKDEEYLEIQLEATIKGANHFGENDMRGAVIASMSDTTIPCPMVVTSHGKSVERRGWHKCKMTCRYYYAGFTTGTMPTTFTTTTAF
jgi:hypothetical protein